MFCDGYRGGFVGGGVDLARRAGADVITMSVQEGPTDEHRTHIREYWA